MSTSRKILIALEELMYLILFSLAVSTVNGHSYFWEASQARILVVACVSAMVGLFATTVVEKALKVRFSILVDLLIAMDLFLSIVLGEASHVYYLVNGYDKILHFFGTLQLAVLGYSLAKFFLRETNSGSHQLLFSLIFGFFFAIGTEAIWELYEFTVDSLCGTNMQKYIPDEFYSAIGSDRSLEADSSAVAAFYSSPEGYRYALMDTMYDILADIGGGTLGILLCAWVFRFRPSLQDKIIYRPKPGVILEKKIRTKDVKK